MTPLRVAANEELQPNDSVEKVGFPKMLEYWWVKTPLLHAAP